MGMGFTRAQAARALGATQGDVARALDWIFSRVDELDAAEQDAPANPDSDRTLGCRDGPESKPLLINKLSVYLNFSPFLCITQRDRISDLVYIIDKRHTYSNVIVIYLLFVLQSTDWWRSYLTWARPPWWATTCATCCTRDDGSSLMITRYMLFYIVYSYRNSPHDTS